MKRFSHLLVVALFAWITVAFPSLEELTHTLDQLTPQQAKSAKVVYNPSYTTTTCATANGDDCITTSTPYILLFPQN